MKKKLNNRLPKSISLRSGQPPTKSGYVPMMFGLCIFVVALQVPVDTDLQEIIKEISIMQQCDSPFIVKYYGSYFKNTDLWVIS